MKRFVFALLLCAATGCTSYVTTPRGFAELDDSSYDYRAVNADGVVIAVRELDNDPGADLEFWAGAIDAKLRRQYTAESVDAIRTEEGVKGIQIRYSASRNGRSHRYWATVFVTEDDVYLVEAAGDSELFDEDTVARAIRSLEI